MQRTLKTLLPILFLGISTSVFCRENPTTKASNNPVQTSAANCTPPTASAELNINNVRATVLARSDMWSDGYNANYEIPTGSGKHSMFVGALWIGGIDAGGQVKVAAQTYRQTGNDFWTGAIDTTTVNITSTRCNFYNRHWKLYKQNVVDFVTGGAASPTIMQWPGNGNSANNESENLAPYVDVNSDGVYNYLDGDYPAYNFSLIYPTVPGTVFPVCNNYLFGDQTIWWVINDVGNTHTETGSGAIGLEIRCQAFAFSSSAPAFDNSTFYKYEMVNRSSITYNNMYFGQWVDPDIGNYIDDYVGCDVMRGLGFCYNGDWDDETASGYGLNPPAIGVDILHGPYADMGDMIDNDLDGCIDCTFLDSAGITLAVADGIVPEIITMSKFVYYENSASSTVGNPVGFADYYDYLRGRWRDGQAMTYGGNGRSLANPVCDYMFPGTSDPSFPTNWSELALGNVPDDRRFLQSAGQFTMEPGEVNYVSTAVVWAKATSGGPNASVTLLKTYDDQVQDLFSNCFSLSGVGIPENNISANISVFPNPSSDYVIFQTSEIVKEYVITIYNASGSLVMQQNVADKNNFRWNTEKLPAGTYFYNLDAGKNNSASGKVVLY